MLVKSASHCFRVGTPAAVAAVEGTGLWEKARGVAIVGGTKVEVALYIQLVVKYYLSNRI